MVSGNVFRQNAPFQGLKGHEIKLKMKDFPSPQKNRNSINIYLAAFLSILCIAVYTWLFFNLGPFAHQVTQNTILRYNISIVFMLTLMGIIFLTMRDRIYSQQVLQATQKDYTHFLKNSADPMIILDEFGTIQFANTAVETVSGYNNEDLLGRHFLKVNILIGKSMLIASKEFVLILGGAERPPFDLTMLRKDGSVFVTEAHARRVTQEDGKMAVYVILREITERKKTEESLIMEKNRAQNYLNIAGVIILSLDQNGNVALINKKGCEILDYSESEILGKNWIVKFTPQDDFLTFKRIFEDMLRGLGKEQKNHESHIITKNGDIRLISWSSTLIRDTANSIEGVLFSGQDITEKREAENQLALQGTALEAAANTIVITDRNGNIVWANKAFSDVSGYSREESVGKNPRILKSGLHNEHFYENMWNTILTGNIYHTEIINRRKDDRLYTEEMTITPVRDRKGEISHFIAIKRDITESKRLQQNLEQANLNLEANTHKLERTLQELASQNKRLQETQDQLIQSEKLAAVGTLSSGIAHEIKNPLAIISLSIEEFEAQADKLDPASKTYIKMIKNAADRANNVIVELLRFARVSDLKAEDVDLHKLIEGTMLLLNNTAKIKGVAMEHVCAGENIILKGDRILLEQIFFNLIVNAIDSTDRGGHVTIQTSLAEKFSGPEAGEKVVIDISDTGCGIPPEILPRIFEPFFTTKEQGKGTGLGLSTVYTLLKRHNGTIDVESTVGVGTKFSVTLPCEIKNS